MSASVILSFRWPMGHRILGLEGAEKCANVHGHNWQADVELPNDDGSLEFGHVKAAIGGWIETHWDHGMLIEASDPFREWLRANSSKHSILAVPPTTEAIAREVAGVAVALLGVTPTRVVVVEGWRNAATWTP